MEQGKKTNLRLQNMQTLLSDIIGESTTLAQLLLQCGFDEYQIRQLHSDHLEEYLDLLVLSFRSATTHLHRARLLSDIREVSYGVSKSEQLTMKELGKRLGISSQRVSQLREKSLTGVKRNHNKHPLMEIVEATANHLLGNPLHRFDELVEDESI